MKNFFHKYDMAIKTFILFIASRILFLCCILQSNIPLSQTLYLFDCEHYNHIAQYGYDKPYLYAFFPMLPLLIKCFGSIGTLVINQIAILLSAILLQKLYGTEDKFKKLLLTTIFLFSVPSFFGMYTYTEPIFILLTICAYYLFQERKHWILLGITIGLTVFIRNTGSLLFFAVFIGMIILVIKKEIKFYTIFQTYIPATIISLLYPIYLQITTGSWKTFITVQGEYWGKENTNPIKLLITQIKIICFNYKNYHPQAQFFYRINEVLTIIIVVTILALIILNIKKIHTINNVVLSIYAILTILVISCSSKNPIRIAPTTSFPRYFLTIFPIYLWIEQLSNKKLILFTIFSTILTFIMATLFSQNVFFF